MQGVIEYLKGSGLHPVVDHFSIALILIAILIDLVASLLPSRLWLRNAAVTLMVLGALAVAGSKVTGGWEAHRVWPDLTDPAKELLKKHASLGHILPWVFGGLAIWRLGLQFFGFLAPTRLIYLLAGVVAAGAILYQGDLGGDLVYQYGVGTALLSQASATLPAPAATSTGTPAPIPTVYVPPTPAAASSPAAAPSSNIGAAPPSIEVSPAAPAATSGTAVKPPPGETGSAAAPESPTPKSTTL